MGLMTRRRSLLKETGGVTPGGPWEELFASINNGTYATDYAIGDLIPLDLGTEGQINMQIVAFDADTLANGQGTAPVTLISKELLATKHRANLAVAGTAGNYTEGTGAIGGWEKCEIRTYLKETIKPLIPANIRSHIINVTKITYILDTTGATVNNATSTDDVWLPSMREINFTGYENSGAIYNSIFPYNYSRIKTLGSSGAQYWWSRSGKNINGFCTVTKTGSSSFGNVDDSSGVVLGFCVG